jgi:hypothetical protein
MESGSNTNSFIGITSKQPSLEFNLVQDIDCGGYPVYSSEDTFFLFRNVFGQWCQIELDTRHFDVSIECYKKCSSVLLGPGKIKVIFKTIKIKI